MNKLQELENELDYQLDLKEWACGDKILQVKLRIKELKKQIKQLKTDAKADEEYKKWLDDCSEIMEEHYKKEV